MKYRALTNENFYYLEAKRIATVLKNNSDISREDLFDSVKENDLLEANNEQNLKQKFNTVYKRLDSLNNYFIESLANESPDIGKFINLLSIIINERIIFDFLNEVLKEKFLLMDNRIENMEFNNFLNEKAEQVEKVGEWSEASRKKIIAKIKSYLIESGYLIKKDNRSKEFNISRPLIPMDILNNIKKEYGEGILKSLLLER